MELTRRLVIQAGVTCSALPALPLTEAERADAPEAQRDIALIDRISQHLNIDPRTVSACLARLVDSMARIAGLIVEGADRVEYASSPQRIVLAWISQTYDRDAAGILDSSCILLCPRALNDVSCGQASLFGVGGCAFRGVTLSLFRAKKATAAMITRGRPMPSLPRMMRLVG